MVWLKAAWLMGRPGRGWIRDWHVARARLREIPDEMERTWMAASEHERAILQHVARRSAEDTDNRDGWCRWSTSDRWPWEWDDYKPLVIRGLLDRREDWKDVMLKLTEAGWTALNAR